MQTRESAPSGKRLRKETLRTRCGKMLALSQTLLPFLYMPYPVTQHKPAESILKGMLRDGAAAKPGGIAQWLERWLCKP